MKTLALIGFGNIGKKVFKLVSEASDLSLSSIVSSQNFDSSLPVYKNIKDIPHADLAILCTPSRLTPSLAEDLLARGISTVDSYDIHSDIYDVRRRLDAIAKANKAVAITAAGWDPGTDSIIRTLFEAMAPKGKSYTNFGPGKSMGHSVAARAIKGVKDALSITVPAGQGLHKREVYIILEEGSNFEEVSKLIKADPYFAKDDTKVRQVEDLSEFDSPGHGVWLERHGPGIEGVKHSFEYKMRANNPALTAQILVSAARAALKQEPGCYTMIEIPPLDFLEGGKEENIRRLV